MRERFRIAAILTASAVMACGNVDYDGTYVGTGNLEANSKGCPALNASEAAEIELESFSGDVLFLTTAGVLMEGTIDSDGWFLADATYHTDADNFASVFVDGYTDGYVLKGSKFFTGMLAGSICWTVVAYDLKKSD